MRSNILNVSPTDNNEMEWRTNGDFCLCLSDLFSPDNDVFIVFVFIKFKVKKSFWNTLTF